MGSKGTDPDYKAFAVPQQDDDSSMTMMVYVIAPSTLPEGFILDAHINDNPNKCITCEVPKGGVVEGQMFLVPLPKDYNGPRIHAPVGRWKDGLCDCFEVGFFHPTVWMAYCCSGIALAQVMTRMQLTWLGGPGPLKSTKNTFAIVASIYVAYRIYKIILDEMHPNATTLIQVQHNYTNYDDEPLYEYPFLDSGTNMFLTFVMFAFVIWFVVILSRTRRSVREQYQIPEEYCAGCEDCCCAYWCGCCSIAQMLRHTGEYEHYTADCCSETGHPTGTPLVV